MKKSNLRTSKEKHVLVVDDDLDILRAVRVALVSAGFEVSVAQDGVQGLAVVAAQKPDLVILDMIMPKRSGLLVLERIRQGDLLLPVIAITCSEMAQHQTYAELLGVADYICKPFKLDRLLNSVSHLLALETV